MCRRSARLTWPLSVGRGHGAFSAGQKRFSGPPAPSVAGKKSARSSLNGGGVVEKRAASPNGCLAAASAPLPCHPEVVQTGHSGVTQGQPGHLSAIQVGSVTGQSRGWCRRQDGRARLETEASFRAVCRRGLSRTDRLRCRKAVVLSVRWRG